MLKRLISNKVVLYMSSRYITYFLQFIISMVLAVRLGPFYLGIWGVLQLLIGYFQQINLGIPYSVQVLLIHKKGNDDYNNIIYNSFFLLGGITILVGFVACGYWIWGAKYLEKFGISWQFYVICLIAVFNYVNSVLMNVFRVENRLLEVAFQQTLGVVVTLSFLFFVREEQLVVFLLFSTLFSAVVSCILFTVRLKLNFQNCRFEYYILKNLILKGFYLFVYNACFYFILISIRTVISKYYSVEEFGNFNFSFTICNAILLLIEAFSFLIYPKMLSNFSSTDPEVVRNSITLLRENYITLSHLLIYGGAFFFPYLTFFFPQYVFLESSLYVIALSIMMSTYCFGFETCLIAKNMEKKAALSTLIALFVNVSLGVFMATIWQVRFEYIILATVVAYFCLSLFSFIFLRKILRLNFWKDFLNFPLLFPYLLFFCCVVIDWHFCRYIMFLFILVNYKQMKKIVNNFFRLLNNPNVINVN